LKLIENRTGGKVTDEGAGVLFETPANVRKLEVEIRQVVEGGPAYGGLS
jgi:hypothetical protein